MAALAVFLIPTGLAVLTVNVGLGVLMLIAGAVCAAMAWRVR